MKPGELHTMPESANPPILKDASEAEAFAYRHLSTIRRVQVQRVYYAMGWSLKKALESVGIMIGA
jgi:hypothetical protein